MRYGINNCQFIGNLGRDPEVKYNTNGTAICNFSIAVTEKRKNEDHTEWVNVVAFGKLAEICGECLNMGQSVYLSGKIQTQSWEKDGVKHYRTQLLANEMRMLSKAEKQQSEKPKEEKTPDDDIPF